LLHAVLLSSHSYRLSLGYLCCRYLADYYFFSFFVGWLCTTLFLSVSFELQNGILDTGYFCLIFVER
jgi:hypothetical protein